MSVIVVEGGSAKDGEGFSNNGHLIEVPFLVRGRSQQEDANFARKFTDAEPKYKNYNY
jgi:hypothetical protein